LLALTYARFGQALFATDVAGMGLLRWDDGTNELESANRQFQEDWQPSLALRLCVFGGATGLAHSYATVPALADAQGRQPVVWVSCYEQPYALPVASDVDRFFDTYARYLEELVRAPGFAQEGSAALQFPWEIPHLLAEDARLVEAVRAGSFDELMPGEASAHRWVEALLEAARPTQGT
jgi:hypothetical protein